MFVLGTLLATLLAAAAHAEPIRVAVSILPQKYFVERIAGKRAAVLVMVGPGDSPATYEPRPRQASELSRARVYFKIGVPFEQAWMPRFQAINSRMLVVDTTGGIEWRRQDMSDDMAAKAEGPSDPHIWTNPALVKIIAAHIRDGFLHLDPGHGAEYEENYRRFLDDLSALDEENRARLAPYSGRAFLVFHPAWGYFADAYGLRQISCEVGGKEPGPKALAGIIDEAKALKIRTIFVQPQFSQARADMIAREIGGHVVAMDPLAEDYVGNMRRVAASIAKSMSAP